MGRQADKRTMETKLIKSGESLNLRIIAETVAKNIMKGAISNDRRGKKV